MLEELADLVGRLRRAIEEKLEGAHAGDAGVADVGDHADGHLPDERRYGITRVPACRNVREGVARGAHALEARLHPSKGVVVRCDDGLQLLDELLEAPIELAHVLAGLQSSQVVVEAHHERGDIAGPRVRLANQGPHHVQCDRRRGGGPDGPSEPLLELVPAFQRVAHDLGRLADPRLEVLEGVDRWLQVRLHRFVP